MEEKEYTNREIDRMFKEIQESLQRIESQTSKTNGRVTRLEMWRQYILGALAIISMLIIPLFFYLAYQIMEIKTSLPKQVSEVVRSELSGKYDIEIKQ